MSSFAMLRVNGASAFKVERVDLNIWVLPGILRRDVVYCDIGVLCQLEEEFLKDVVEFELRMPFRADSSEVKDLIPIMRGDRSLCALIFGTTDLDDRLDAKGTWLKVDDNNEHFLLMSLENGRSELVVSKEGASSMLKISTAKLTFGRGTRLYLRFRVQTHFPNRLWAWQSGSRAHSHAVCDIRFNEFREPGSDSNLDISRVLGPDRVNCFMISSARLRTTRMSPSPKYVRVLENDAWAKYLDRRLSRFHELFVITYWSDVKITVSHPYRAFIELEKRTPTATRTILLSVLLLACIFLSLLPLRVIQESVGAGLLGFVWRNVRTFFYGGISLTAFFGLIRYLALLVNKKNLDFFRKQLAILERRLYRYK